MTQVLVVGDSHVVALGHGYAGRPGGADRVKFGKLFPSPASLTPFFEERAGQLHLLDPEAREVLRELTGREFFSDQDRGAWVCLSLGFTTTVLMSSDTWRTHAPWQAPGEAGAQIISSAVFRAIALDHYRYALDFYRAIKALGLNCIAISAPPPLLGGDWFSDGVDEAVLLAVDNLARRVVQDELDRLGTPYVTPPPESYSGEGASGFRHPDFKGEGNKGFVHANPAYGRLMMDRVLEKVVHLAGRAAVQR